MATQYKTHTYKILNNDAGKNKLVSIRREINGRQNNTTASLFNVVLNIAGLFNVALGFAAVVFGGAVDGNAKYLEYLEDMYTTIYEEFTRPGSSKIISNVVITQRFVGKDSGGERGVIWKAEKPTYKFGNPIIHP
ncbi:hypothetical protein AALA22_15530 [Anaerovoracaceae bacterium 41-7]|jgi:hypothetical protein